MTAKKFLDNAGLKRFYDNLSGRFQTHQQVQTAIIEASSDRLEDPEIVSVFMNDNEIWIASTGWATMKVFTDKSDANGTSLEKNEHGYYVFNISSLNSADTLEFATDSTKTVTTGAITGNIAGIYDFNGKIIAVTAGSSTPEILYPVSE